jgi:hypothetical protein
MAIKTIQITDTFSKLTELTDEALQYAGDSAEITSRMTASNLSSAIAELDSDLHGAAGGSAATDLNTDAKNIVAAINEIENVFDASARDITVSGNLTINTGGNDAVVQADIVPSVDNTYDLGTSGTEWRHLYIDGTANVDKLAADSATIAANIDIGGNTIIGASSSNTVNIRADVSSNIIPSADNTYDLGAVGSEWKDLYIDGTATVDTLQVDESATVTGNLTVNGASTTINSTTITLGNANTDNVVFGADVNSNIIPQTDATFSLGTATQQWDVLHADSAQLNKAVIDNITIDGTSLTSSTTLALIASTGDIELNANGADVILKDDTVTYGSLTNNSGNLQIKSGATLAVSFSGANTTLSGSLTVPTTLTVNGNTTLGNGGDTISLGSTFSSNLVPTTDNAVDLGSSGAEWRHLYIDGTANVDKLSADSASVAANLTAGGNTVLGTDNTNTLTVRGPINLPTTGSGSVTTTVKTTVHEAINELHTDIGTANFNALGPADRENVTNLTAAINKHDSAFGPYDGPSSFDAYITNRSNYLTSINSLASTLQTLEAAVADDSDSLSILRDQTIGSLADIDAPLSNTSIVVAINDLNDVNSNANHVTNDILRYNGTRMVPTGANLTVDASGNTSIGGTLGVSGNLTVNGATTTINSGTINIGTTAATDDNVAINARVTTSIVPDVDNSVDLGSSVLEWRHLYVDGTANLDRLVADSATITQITGNLTPSADDTYDLGTSGSEWRNLYIDGTANIDTLTAGGTTVTTLTASGNATFNGTTNAINGTTLNINTTNINIGDLNTDNVAITAAVASNIIPNTNGTKTLGNTGARWDAYIDLLNVTGATTLGDSAGDTITLNGTTTAVNGFTGQSSGTTKFTVESYGAKIHGTKNNTTLQLYNSTNDGTWVNGSEFGRIEVYSADISGDGVGLRGALLFEATESTGSGSSFSIDLETGNDDNFLNRVFEIEPDGNTTIAGTLTSGTITTTGNVGIGTGSSIDAGVKLHVQESDAGLVASTGVSVALFERAGDCGITIGCDGDGESTVFFGDAANSTIGRVNYDHADNSLQLWANNEERMRISSNGNVGIGTTGTPSSPLEVVGASPIRLTRAGLGGPNLEFANDDGVIADIQTTTTKSMVFKADPSNDELGSYMSWEIDNDEKMRIDANGNVGIGETSPSTYGKLAILGTDGTPSIHLRSGTTAFAIEPNTNEVAVKTVGANDQLTFGTADAERMRIDSTGNVGINTSPSYKLDVFGTTRSYVSNGGAWAPATGTWEYTPQTNDIIVVKNGDSTTGTGSAASIFFDAGARTSDGTLGAYGRIAVLRENNTNQNSAMAFWVRDVSSGGEKMRIDSQGRVGIGSTNFISNFTVGTDTNDDTQGLKTIRLGYTSGGTRSALIQKDTNYIGGTEAALSIFSSTGTSDSPIIFYTDSTTERMRIAANGNVGIGTTSPDLPLDVERDAGAATTGDYLSLELSTSTTGTPTTLASGMRFMVDGTESARITGSAEQALIFKTAGNFERMRINASGVVTMPANVSSTTTTSGTLVVTGGVGISGALNVGGTVTASTFSGNASSASSVYVDSFESGDTVMPLLITDNGGAGNRNVYEDSKLYYNSTNDILVSSRFESNVVTGTAPFTVASTTNVANLNADTVDGYEGIALYDGHYYVTTATTTAVTKQGRNTLCVFRGTGNQTWNINASGWSVGDTVTIVTTYSTAGTTTVNTSNTVYLPDATTANNGDVTFTENGRFTLFNIGSNNWVVMV